MTTAIQLPSLAPVRGGIASVMQPIPVSYEQWRAGVRVWRATGGGETFVQPGFCQPEEVDDKPFSDLEQDEVPFLPFMVGGTAMCAPGETELDDTVMAEARRALADNAADLTMGQMWLGDAGTGGQVNPLFIDGISDVTPSGGGPVESVDALLDAACSDVSGDHFFFAHRAHLARYKKDLDLTWDDAAGVYRYGQWAFAFECDGIGDADLILAPRPYMGEGPEQVVDHLVARQNSRMVVIERLMILAYHPVGAYRTTVTFA